MAQTPGGAQISSYNLTTSHTPTTLLSLLALVLTRILVISLIEVLAACLKMQQFASSTLVECNTLVRREVIFFE